MMTSRTSLGLLTVMGPIGWFLACVFGVLACMLAADASSHDIPWQILGSLIIGSTLAAVPTAVMLSAAYCTINYTPGADANIKRTSWRWITVACLCGLAGLVLPLSLVAAASEDDTLLVSVPFNLMIVGAALIIACWPHKRRAAVAICTIHLVGIVLATFAAAAEIGSVVLSGPLLLMTGLALSLVGTRPRTARVVFALSTVVFILIASLIIATAEISERAAEVPLFAAIVAYQILFVPLGLLMLYRELSEKKKPFRAQFGLKQILGVMAIVCVASALTKLAYSVDDGVRVAVAIISGISVLTGLVTTIWAGCWTRWTDYQSQVGRANAL